MSICRLIFIFLFVYERDRYYLGAIRFPAKITQEFWDDMNSRKIEYESCKDYQWPKPDTKFGTSDEDFEKEIGERPKVPTIIKELRLFILILLSFLSSIFMIYK